MADLYLLSAPPASGKTYWIAQHWVDFAERSIFLSPLRAICEEFEQSHLEGSYANKVFYLRSRKEALEFLEAPPKKALCLMTFEVFMSCSNQWSEKFLCSSKKPAAVFIDEFHLIKIWGDSFRPILHETLYFLAIHELSVIGMSASLDQACRSWVYSDLKIGFNKLVWLNHGNMSFKNSPVKQFYVRLRPLFYFFLGLCLIRARMQGESVLVFCRYRHEVFSLCSFFRPFIRTLGVVGGQTHGLSKKLKVVRPTLIAGTSCLGHGVNLPCLSSVFCNYREENEALRLQMLSRGGRKGERFITVELW